MFDIGWIDEVRSLIASGVPRDAVAFNSLGYREALEVLDGTRPLEHAIERVAQLSRNYAKRQITWQNRSLSG
jgi:tRNA dimethylallyltransferase